MSNNLTTFAAVVLMSACATCHEIHIITTIDMSKIVTLGEIMLRLSPQGTDRFIQADAFRIIPGGGEANVAISLAN